MFGINLVPRRMMDFLVDGEKKSILYVSVNCKTTLNTRLGSLCLILTYFKLINLLKNPLDV